MIYFALQQDGLVKIGYSQNVKQRLASLPKSKLIASVEAEDSPGVEAIFHGWFWPYRSHDEYFRITQEQIDEAIMQWKEHDGYLVNRAGQKECRFCSHQWLPRRANPKICPRCKRYDWSAR